MWKKGLLALLVCTLSSVPYIVSYAQGTTTSISESQDCNEISIPDIDSLNLTREEKIALLDRVLMDSLSQYSPCRNAMSASSGGGGSSASGEMQGTGAGSGQNQGYSASSAPASSTSSEASGELQGTESAMVNEEIQIDTQSEDSGGMQGIEPETQEAAVTESPSAPAMNGKLPEDIPPADNDSVIAKQLREAAIQETDPVKQAELWNKYRRYKNLPER